MPQTRRRQGPGAAQPRPWHGTLSILAGNRLDGTVPGFPGFTDFWAARRSRSFRSASPTGSCASGPAPWSRASTTPAQQGAHVLSMTMGGVSSQALVDAVNLAYDAGVSWSPPPATTSPASPAEVDRVPRPLPPGARRLRRDGRRPRLCGLSTSRTMQGNYGPASKMETAIGAYTPNVPWAQIDCGKVVDMDGAGTSSATPQMAAAAALWLAEHWDAVEDYPGLDARRGGAAALCSRRRRNRPRAWTRGDLREDRPGRDPGRRRARRAARRRGKISAKLPPAEATLGAGSTSSSAAA